MNEDWKCPTCGASSIDGMVVDHEIDCDYCAKRIKRMIQEDNNKQEKKT